MESRLRNGSRSVGAQFGPSEDSETKAEQRNDNLWDPYR